MARAKILWARVIAIVVGFVLPLVLLTGLLGAPGIVHAAIASILFMAGVFVERWLFFAEARHVVNLYHGRQHT